MSGMESKGRVVGCTEYGWCRAVPGGTGIAVLSILISKSPDMSILRNALHKLQNSHPILRSRIHFNNATITHSFITSPTPFVQIKSFSLSSTFKIFESHPHNSTNYSISPLHILLEHELNENSWCNPSRSKGSCDDDMFFASVYALPNSKWVLVLRLHAAACDRTTAVAVLRELLELAGAEEGGVVQKELGNKGEVSLGIEDLIPRGKGKKGIWSRGMDMVSYSVNSLRLTNLKFKDTKSARCSRVVRFQMDENDTQRVLSGCKARGIKLCGALAAAGLIAAYNSTYRADHHQRKKYGVITLTDCRSLLQPPLSAHHFGFYHSAILNSQTIKGGESLWDLAQKQYGAFSTSKACNKHFSDMADLNFLMCRAIENPSLTSSGSLRSSFITVFEDTVVDNSDQKQSQVGLVDYMGCASAHGIGPSIALFDTIRDGRLDCVCVYPAPLHSREQMQDLVDAMKRILVDCY